MDFTENEALALSFIRKNEVYTPQDDDLKVKKILAYCTKPRSKKELLSFLQLNDKKSFEKVYLNPLLSTRKLRMTIPNKPTSKNQKYETVR